MPSILLADDSALIRLLLRQFLESQTNFTVCAEAENGMEAIERARELRPDLILIDLWMPGFSGAIASAIIKEEMPETKIVLFTLQGAAVPGTLESISRADLVVQKDADLRELPSKLNALLEGKSAAPESATAASEPRTR